MNTNEATKGATKMVGQVSGLAQRFPLAAEWIATGATCEARTASGTRCTKPAAINAASTIGQAFICKSHARSHYTIDVER